MRLNKANYHNYGQWSCLWIVECETYSTDICEHILYCCMTLAHATVQHFNLLQACMQLAVGISTHCSGMILYYDPTREVRYFHDNNMNEHCSPKIMDK